MPERTYTWKNTRRTKSYRVNRNEQLSKFVTIAMIAAVIVHASLYYVFGKMHWRPDSRSTKEWQVDGIHVEQLKLPEELQKPANDPIQQPALEPVEIKPLEMPQTVMDNPDVDISPNLKDENISVPAPPIEGLPSVEMTAPEMIKPLELQENLDRLGMSPSPIDEEKMGQLVIDVGGQELEHSDLDDINEAEIRKGIQGGNPEGVLDNYSTLDDLIAQPKGALGDKTKPARLSSDLLFDFNSAVLKEAAKLSLIKLAALIVRHPDTWFVIEGHTDTIGSESFNLDLGKRRAQAVRDWLKRELELTGEKILVRSAGESKPIVSDAKEDRDKQAINRRVEIHMRKEKPQNLRDAAVNDQKHKELPQRGILLQDETPALPQSGLDFKKAKLVTPPPAPIMGNPAPKAEVITKESLRAVPVEPEPTNRAIPVDPDEPPRALPVEEEELNQSEPTRAVPVVD